MNPIKTMQFMICFNFGFMIVAALTAYGIAGYASSGANYDPSIAISYGTDVKSIIIGAAGVGTLGAAVGLIVGYNPFIFMAYGLMVGTFGTTLFGFLSMFHQIASVISDYANIANIFIVIFTVLFAISMIYFFIQMTTGGQEYYS